MKIVEPNVERIVPANPLTHIERVGRVCYKSEGNIAPGSSVNFCRNIVKRGHLAVIEHYRFIVEVDEYTYDRVTSMHPDYIKHTCTEDRCILSASARGWIDFYNSCMSIAKDADMVYYDDFENQAYMAARCSAAIMYVISMQCNCSILFDSRMKDSLMWIPSCKVISQDQLTDFEYSVHGWETLKFTCDRGVSHELVRHRPFSFAQESTRYCNYSGDKFDANVTFIVPSTIDKGINRDRYDIWKSSCIDCEADYFKMLAAGAKPQEARSVLNNSVKTEVMVTGTMEMWQHFFDLRCDPAAHPDMQVVAKKARAIIVSIKH